ncbi:MULTISPECIES: DUF1127 domain-containing protein [Pseudovibrio]|uniref:DUF1127 domain-containing protein n=1 Tax=Stappiaceae TaxID=2821832 RepID=UPI002365300F|nr:MULTISPECIES: DUF1127 domain-containing protein [Pseudovibrio]MDD7911387.1 DUF1127 domain-containing protein [Pseudovibrio exalbescens]MDX5592926.1 DUF1127 domain-containing protein [Pseudovibrio sp. SPO723]
MTLAFPTPTEYRNPNRANAGTFEPLTLKSTLLGLFHVIVDQLRAYRNRRAIAHLAEQEDRLLQDVGLTRSDVDSALASHEGIDPSWYLTCRANERYLDQMRETRTMR